MLSCVGDTLCVNFLGLKMYLDAALTEEIMHFQVKEFS